MKNFIANNSPLSNARIAKNFFSFFVLLSILLIPKLAYGYDAYAENAEINKFYRAEVSEIVGENISEVAGEMSPYQTLKVKFLNGARKNETVIIEHGRSFTLTEAQKLKKGDKIIMNENLADGEVSYYIFDKDRIGSLIVIAIFFLASAVFFGRLKGLSSIFGLLVSLAILTVFVVPQIAAGANPLIISVSGAFMIAVFSLYFAHGFNKRTTVALASTLITLGIAILLAQIFVTFGKLSGLGAEETFYLQIGKFALLDFKGLLLGGIIIGALGVLDDITVSQTAIVHELRQANPLLGFGQLYTHALSVGREHIASLVNTLALAYIGASLPLILLFISDNQMPFWMTFNEEMIAEEIIRTLVGSTALVFAVPISTFLAVTVFSKKLS